MIFFFVEFSIDRFIPWDKILFSEGPLFFRKGMLWRNPKTNADKNAALKVQCRGIISCTFWYVNHSHPSSVSLCVFVELLSPIVTCVLCFYNSRGMEPQVLLKSVSSARYDLKLAETWKLLGNLSVIVRGISVFIFLRLCKGCESAGGNRVCFCECRESVRLPDFTMIRVLNIGLSVHGWLKHVCFLCSVYVATVSLSTDHVSYRCCRREDHRWCDCGLCKLKLSGKPNLSPVDGQYEIIGCFSSECK